ncbi:MAG: TrmH family RNA methyltransferase [Actinomycetes bacterium]
MPVIDNPADPRLADYVGLTDVARRRRVEPEIDGAGIFIAEGEPVVRRAMSAGFRLRSLLVDPKRYDAVRDLAGSAPAYLASPDVLAAVTGFNVHRGVLASFVRKPQPELGELLTTSRRLLVCEDLTSTTNLGAVLRSAAALGVDGVLLSPECCDPFYRRAVRVSMGEALRLPTHRLDAWPAALTELHAAGFSLIALTPDVSAEPIDSVPIGDKAALLLGEEGAGLSDDALGAADRRVRIPLAAGVDSLNVAAAAAIACYVFGRAELG